MKDLKKITNEELAKCPYHAQFHQEQNNDDPSEDANS